MTDPNLLVFGCAVTFLAVAGAYVYIRERWAAHARESRIEQRGVSARARNARRAA